MTTIAYRAGVIAADSLVTCHGNTRDSQAVKIQRYGRILAGAAGSSAMARLWFDWMKGGLQGPPPPRIAQDHDLDAFAVLPDGKIVYWDGEGIMYSRADIYAVGTGSRFAMGAMQVGADPEAAVRAAMVFDCFTGGEVLVLRRPDGVRNE